LGLKSRNFFQKYPKQGSSACCNSVQDKRSVKNKMKIKSIKKIIKKGGASKAPKSEIEKEKFERKICVIKDLQIKRKNVISART